MGRFCQATRIQEKSCGKTSFIVKFSCESIHWQVPLVTPIFISVRYDHRNLFRKGERCTHMSNCLTLDKYQRQKLTSSYQSCYNKKTNSLSSFLYNKNDEGETKMDLPFWLRKKTLKGFWVTNPASMMTWVQKKCDLWVDRLVIFDWKSVDIDWFFCKTWWLISADWFVRKLLVSSRLFFQNPTLPLLCHVQYWKADNNW